VALIIKSEKAEVFLNKISSYHKSYEREYWNCRKRMKFVRF